MSVLHAVWSVVDTLHVWGERALDGERLPRPRGRAPADGRPRRHPYALPAAELVEALSDLTGTDCSAVGVTETTVLLPSAAAPLPSLDLPGASAVTAPVEGIFPWRADALELSGADLLEVLLALPDEAPPGARPDEALVTAARIATLVLDRVAGGRVLPGLVSRAGRWEARWLPVVGTSDRSALAALASSLPPSLLAAPGEEGRSPGVVLRELVEQLTDAAVRDALSGTDLAKVGRRRRVSVEEAWLAALTGTDPCPRADPADLAVLAKDLDGWHRSGSGGGPLRTAFRLVPPVADGAGGETPGSEAPCGETPGSETPDGPEVRDPQWRLEFLLQATDDPSLLVPAADVWEAGSTLTFLERTLEHPQERLLTDLGRASRLWPPLDAALHTATPDGHGLDVAGVVAFLHDTAPLLEQAGFGVLLPAELRRAAPPASAPVCGPGQPPPAAPPPPACSATTASSTTAGRSRSATSRSVAESWRSWHG